MRCASKQPTEKKSNLETKILKIPVISFEESKQGKSSHTKKISRAEKLDTF
jgi:hypothetical protein